MGSTHPCPPHDFDLLADPNDQYELLPERVLVVVVLDLDVGERGSLRLKGSSELGQVARARRSERQGVGLVRLAMSFGNLEMRWQGRRHNNSPHSQAAAMSCRRPCS